MNRPHLLSGGRYPVLRALGILYLVLAGLAVLSGLIAAGWALVSAPWDVGNRIVLALLALAGTFFVVVTMLAIAEVIKLAIDIEHNTRIAALRSFSGAAGAEAMPTGGRLRNDEEETAEAALIRGH